MKRRKPLRRGGALARGPGPKPGGSLSRSPLARRGARAARRAEALEAFRRAVLARAGGRCERCGAQPGSRPLERLEAHHLLPRARGGSDDPSNGAALCGACHRAVHEHRAADWASWLR